VFRGAFRGASVKLLTIGSGRQKSWLATSDPRQRIELSEARLSAITRSPILRRRIRQQLVIYCWVAKRSRTDRGGVQDVRLAHRYLQRPARRGG
jgi:hypothetical protein